MRKEEEVFSIFDNEEDLVQMPDEWAEEKNGKLTYKRPVYHPLPDTDRRIGLKTTYTLLPYDEYVLPRLTHRLYDNGIWFKVLWDLDMVPSKPDFVTDRKRYLTEPIRLLGNNRHIKPTDWYDRAMKGDTSNAFLIIESHLSQERLIELYTDARGRLDVAEVRNCEPTEWMTYFYCPWYDDPTCAPYADFQLIKSSKAINPTINPDIPYDAVWDTAE